jgi:hypothetical protein
MALKFSDRPQVFYDDNVQRQGLATTAKALPPGAQPMTTAPQTPVLVFEKDGGAPKWAHYRADAWRTLKGYKDSFSGRIDWREDGTTVDQPLAWLPAPKGTRR